MSRLNQKSESTTLLSNLALWVFLGLLAYMPLHILLSTWLGTSLNILDITKILKDVVLVIGFTAALLASLRMAWLNKLAKDRLVWLIGLYGLLTMAMVVIKPVDTDAEILAVVYNLRFLLFFLYAGLLVNLFRSQRLKGCALRATLGVAFIVLVFGFIQYMWLPDNILENFGYARENGVLPVFYIDDKPDFERIMSTLRDPNSLGSYIIIILSIALTYLLNVKNKNLKRALAGFVGLAVICLWFTFSRGAWIGALAATVVVFWQLYKRRANIKISGRLVAAVGAILVVGLAGLWLSRETYFVRNIIFHADESTVLEDPNQLRLRFWQESIDSAVENPLGYGLGTAGLPSIRNNQQGTVLNENYYLQILHEIGIIGLGLLIAILVVVGSRLYQLSRSDPLALSLLTSFIGLAITNLLVHAWANEAVAYTWWGLAGLVVFIAGKPESDRLNI